MDNAQKAIMIGVGLFITIIIIAAVMAITGMGQNLLNSGSKQITNISDQIQQQLTADYDGATLTGAEALTGIQKYYSDNNVTVYFTNTKGSTTGTCVSKKSLSSPPSTFSTTTRTSSASANVATNSSQVPYANFTDVSNATYYINPAAVYGSQLITTSDGGAVVGIFIFKK